MSTHIHIGKIPRKREHEIRCPLCNKLLFKVRDGVIEIACTRYSRTMLDKEGNVVRRPCLGMVLEIDT